MHCMEWSTLVPVAFGGAVALAGSLIGSWFTDRRARGREDRAWSREDDLRNYDQKRDAYLRYLQIAGKARDRVESLEPGVSEEQTRAYLNDLDDVWREIQVYGSPIVFDMSLDVNGHIGEWAHALDHARRRVNPIESDDAINRMAETMDSAYYGLIYVIREELGAAPPPTSFC